MLFKVVKMRSNIIQRKTLTHQMSGTVFSFSHDSVLLSQLALVSLGLSLTTGQIYLVSSYGAHYCDIFLYFLQISGVSFLTS